MYIEFRRKFEKSPLISLLEIYKAFPKFDVFTTISIASKPLLLAQKFHAILNRKRNKGRDFYDIVFLLSLGVEPDYDFLTLKQHISNEKQPKEAVLTLYKTIDMNEIGKDFVPFLFNAKETQKITQFEAFIIQQKF